MIFHVYGSHLDYEKIIRQVRERTCADILLQTDHITSDASLTEETDPARLTPKQWDPWMNHVFLPATASEYGACRADIHELWKEYLKAHHLKAADLLRDGVHLNAHGEWLMAELLKAYLAPLAPKAGYDPMNEPRVHTVVPVFSAGQNSLRLEFTGTRADLVFKPKAKGAVEVLLDGKRPSANPALYGFTRVSAFPMTDWPVLLKVGAGTPLVAEDRSLRISQASADCKVCHFILSGTTPARTARASAPTGSSPNPAASCWSRMIGTSLTAFRFLSAPYPRITRSLGKPFCTVPTPPCRGYSSRHRSLPEHRAGTHRRLACSRVARRRTGESTRAVRFYCPPGAPGAAATSK